MKLIQSQSHVDLQGADAHNFTLKGSAKIFKILSDGIYSDKILAVIREISTNALESQMVNGNADKPFDVHLPTWTEPFFYVRDYGTGMSDETINTIYSHLGVSSKDQSNEYSGCLGIGKLSCLSYHTKTFTVESWYGGTHTIYSCFFNEDGIPSIAKMSESPSTEPSGVKVQCAVDRYDFSNFEIKARNVYRYFPIMPNFVGHSITITPPTYSVKSDTYAIRSRELGCQVVMGPIAYPVKYEDSSLTTAQKSVLNAGIDIFVNIGDVDIDVSREGLSYDKRTKVILLSKIDSIVLDLMKDLQAAIDKCPTLYKARLTAISMFKNMGSNVNLIDVNKLSYKGDTTFGKQVYDTSVPASTQVVLYRVNKTRRRYTEKFTPTLTSSINWETFSTLYEDDCVRGGLGRVLSLHRSTNSANASYVVKFIGPNSRQAFYDLVGCTDSDFTKTSSLPPANRAARAGGTSITKVVKFDDSKKHVNKSSYWDNCEIDLSDGGYYVEFNRFSAVKNGRKIDPADLQAVITFLKHINVDIPVIYGIKSADVKDIEDCWIDAMDWIQDQIDDYISTLPESVNDILTREKNCNTYVPSVLTILAKELKDNAINKEVNRVKDANPYKKYVVTCEKIRELFKLNLFKINLGVSTVSSISVNFRHFLEKYPLLDQYEYRTPSGKTLEHLVKYIQMVDEENKQ